MDDFHYVLSAHGTLCELTTTLDTRQHVPAVEEHAVHGRVHADLAQVVVFCFWGREGGKKKW